MSDEDILKRLEKIERMLKKYTEEGYIQYVKKILSSYFRLINIYLQEGKISPSVIFPEIRDPISVEIIEILFQYGSMNTTKITEELKRRRGRASRRTVREKLQKLVDKGIVDCVEKKSEKEYMMSKTAVRRWLKVLGIDIKGG